MASLSLPNFRSHEADEFTPHPEAADNRRAVCEPSPPTPSFSAAARLGQKGLSIENGWLDGKATKVLAELEGRSCINLIERAQQGQQAIGDTLDVSIKF